jgi:hypothetical protein
VDLVIVCSGPLDSSPGTLELVERKVDNYLATIAYPNFARTYHVTDGGRVRILISSEYFVSDTAKSVIKTLALRADKQGVVLSLANLMTSQSD